MKLKLNTNKKVIDYNADDVFPEPRSRDDWSQVITTFSITEKEKQKLERLRLKYKVSRSALIRILINSVE
jgi:hypothetical protein